MKIRNVTGMGTLSDRRYKTGDNLASAFVPSPFPVLKTRRPKIGEWLVSRKWITPDQLEVALKEQAARPGLLGELMVQLNFISGDQLLTALSALSGLPFVTLEHLVPDAAVVQAIPFDIARQHQLILFRRDKNSGREELHVALADPEDILALDQVRELMGCDAQPVPHIIPYHATLKGIAHALEVYYPHPHSTAAKPAPMPFDDRQEGEIIRLVNNLILEAVRSNASDIHLSPTARDIEINCRNDGLLRLTHTFHKQLWSALSVRLKIMANLDIAESRRPQNGRFSLTLMGREIDFRLSCHPTIHGENLVLRILDKTHSLRTLDGLGFKSQDIDLIKRLVCLPQGMIILSGPTGAGKTTTLYALLGHMDAHTRNIMTLEEPVEYCLPHIRQTEIREGGPFRFAEGVRSLLRQDPDVIFISEIRDPETAQMAFRGAMTGHLVLATLHARDSFTVAQRFYDLGISPALLDGNLTAGISQRLVRRLCEVCRQPCQLTKQEQDRYFSGFPLSQIYGANGCPDCHQTGYKGREAIAEVVLLNKGWPGTTPAKPARRSPHPDNIPSLWNRGLEKVLQGKTTLAEIRRVIGEDLYPFQLKSREFWPRDQVDFSSPVSTPIEGPIEGETGDEKDA